MTHSETLVAHPPAVRTSLELRACRRLLEARLDDLREGAVEVADGDRLGRFGMPADPALAARIEIRDPRTYRSVALGGAIGAAEAYASGWWTASDLTSLIRIVARNPGAAAGIDGWTTRATMAASLVAVGRLFEAGGDWQLARFRRDPANRGRVCDTGFWRYTRHPNYFGDAVVWWGFFAFAAATPGGWWTGVGPLLMTVLLVRVSGVAMLEPDLRRTKAGYRAYVARTSPFLPWPPRR